MGGKCCGLNKSVPKPSEQTDKSDPIKQKNNPTTTVEDTRGSNNVTKSKMGTGIKINIWDSETDQIYTHQEHFKNKNKDTIKKNSCVYTRQDKLIRDALGIILTQFNPGFYNLSTGFQISKNQVITSASNTITNKYKDEPKQIIYIPARFLTLDLSANIFEKSITISRGNFCESFGNMEFREKIDYDFAYLILDAENVCEKYFSLPDSPFTVKAGSEISIDGFMMIDRKDQIDENSFDFSFKITKGRVKQRQESRKQSYLEYPVATELGMNGSPFYSEFQEKYTVLGINAGKSRQNMDFNVGVSLLFDKNQKIIKRWRSEKEYNLILNQNSSIVYVKKNLIEMKLKLKIKYEENKENNKTLQTILFSYTQNLPKFQQVFGEKSLIFSEVLIDMGKVERDLGLLKESIENFEQCLEIIKNNLGALHPCYIQHLNLLGVTYEINEQYEKSENCYQHALKLSHEIFHEKHAMCGKILNNFGCLYLQGLHKPEKARKYFEMCLEIEKQNYGEQSMNYADTLLNIGYAEDRMKEYHKSIGRYNQALQIIKQKKTVRCMQYAKAMKDLALIYLQTQQYDEGLQKLKISERILKGLGQEEACLKVQNLINKTQAKLSSIQRQSSGRKSSSRM